MASDVVRAKGRARLRSSNGGCSQIRERAEFNTYARGKLVPPPSIDRGPILRCETRVTALLSRIGANRDDKDHSSTLRRPREAENFDRGHGIYPSCICPRFVRIRRADVTTPVVKVAVEALSRLSRHFLRAELLIKARYRRFPFFTSTSGRSVGSAPLGSAVSVFDKSSAAATGLSTFQREFVAPETTINFHRGKKTATSFVNRKVVGEARS